MKVKSASDTTGRFCVAHPLRALRVAFGEVPFELRSTVHFPFPVGLGQLAEAFAGLRVNGSVRYQKFRIELRPSFENERMNRPSRLIRRTVARLDLARHLLMIKKRGLAEVTQQMG